MRNLSLGEWRVNIWVSQYGVRGRDLERVSGGGRSSEVGRGIAARLVEAHKTLP